MEEELEESKQVLSGEVIEKSHEFYHSVADDHKIAKEQLSEEYQAQIDDRVSILQKMFLISMIQVTQHFGSMSQQHVTFAISAAWEDFISQMERFQQPSSTAIN